MLFGIISPKDFLAQCQGIANLLDVVGQFLNQVLTLFGITIPNIHDTCTAVYQTLIQ